MADAGADLNAGANYFGALTDQERKTEAYNALKNAYGPAIAYSPEGAFNAAKASVAEQTIPTEVAKQKADLLTQNLQNTETAGNQQRLAAYRATQMLASQAGQDGSIPADAYDKIVRPNASLLGIDPEHVDQFGQLLSQPGGVAYVNHVAQALIGPTKVTGNVSYGLDANGQPVAITRDQYGNVHQQSLGGTVTTQQQNATTSVNRLTNTERHQGVTEAQGNTRLGIAQQNANTNAYNAGVRANNTTFGAPAGALPGDNRPSANFGGGNALPKPSTDLIGAGNPPGSTTAPAPLFNRLPPKGKQQAIGNANQIVNAGTQLQTTNTILDRVQQQISPYTAGTGSMLKDLPGSAQADLKANLKTLSAQGLTAWIQSLKNSSGQTGIGRVLQSEANAAMTLFGNMEQDQSAKQLQLHAQLFRQTVNRLYQHQKQAFSAMYGVQPHEAIGTEDPMAAPPPAGGLPQGWKYLGPAK